MLNDISPFVADFTTRGFFAMTTLSYFKSFDTIQTNDEGMVSGFPLASRRESEEARNFCVRKSSEDECEHKTSPHGGRDGEAR